MRQSGSLPRARRATGRSKSLSTHRPQKNATQVKWMAFVHVALVWWAAFASITNVLHTLVQVVLAIHQIMR